MNLQDRTPIPLTEEEKLNPISKFYTTELAAPTNPAALEALLAGQRIQNLPGRHMKRQRYFYSRVI